MKQILQHLGNGETMLAEVPAPNRSPGSVLIETSLSLVSLGTEKMLIDFGKSGLIAKARSQPDKVKQVLQKIKTDGLWSTVDAIRAKLDAPIALGYCNVGRVIEADLGSEYRPGDRVISNGPHAEVVSTPANLTARIPDSVDDETAAFTVVGAIGLQGIRLIGPTLGERIAVFGLGLIGLLAVQILRANGCQVLGIDLDPSKLALARSFGAHTVDLSAGQDPIAVAESWTSGVGVDAVLITASTKSDELVHQSAIMCRHRGRIVLVGVVGLNLRRADFYEKELTFQVSCSYGPGRYDPNYEKKGLDYPIGFVRWTEKRNFEAVLQLMADRKIQVRDLISHRFAFDDALAAYGEIQNRGAMGIVLNYSRGPAATEDRAAHSATEVSRNGHAKPAATAISGDHVAPVNQASSASRFDSSKSKQSRPVGLAVVGSGEFATRTLLPLLPAQGIHRNVVVSSQGVSAAHAAKKFGFAEATSDLRKALESDHVDAVIISTPHNTHAALVCSALRAGKHVFVEKPLGLSEAEMEQVQRAALENKHLKLMIGFNRRFSKHSQAIKKWLTGAPSGIAVQITVNAGKIPANHWIQDRAVGGGRIIGEGCHFVDLARFFVGSPITSTSAIPLRGGDGRLGDCVSLGLSFDNGSVATVQYLSNGSKDYPKERIEVYAGGKVILCDNFRSTREFGGRGKLSSFRQDKGHQAELAAFFHAIATDDISPIPLEELLEVSLATIRLDEQARKFAPGAKEVEQAGAN
jgi:predicted dehydrogenase/threonine dehydrogenase-like Zn-dependent dehydrogenase